MFSIDMKFLHDTTKVSQYAQHIFDHFKEKEQERLLPVNWCKSENFK